MASLLPVALLTGFLGAGKTTFARRLLRDAAARGLRVGVIVNEWGAASIDGTLLRASGAELLSELAGGCACCDSQDEMIGTMLQLGQLPRAERPDLVLLEASGLADPLVMLDALTVPALLPLVRVASLLCVLDAARWPELSGAESAVAPLLRRQLALADRVVVSKGETAFQTEAARREAQARWRGLNEGARWDWTDDQTSGETFAAFWARALCDDFSLHAPHAGAAQHGAAQTLVVPMRRPIARERLEAALRALGEKVWRAKGFARIAGENDLFLVQWSGTAPSGTTIERFEAHDLNAFPRAELVFIGSALDEDALWRDFAGTPSPR